MTKAEGKLHAEIVKRLEAVGVESSDIAVATLGRGPDHLILVDGETIGEYNHISKRLYLYELEQ